MTFFIHNSQKVKNSYVWLSYDSSDLYNKSTKIVKNTFFPYISSPLIGIKQLLSYISEFIYDTDLFLSNIKRIKSDRNIFCIDINRNTNNTRRRLPGLIQTAIPAKFYRLLISKTNHQYIIYQKLLCLSPLATSQETVLWAGFSHRLQRGSIQSMTTVLFVCPRQKSARRFNLHFQKDVFQPNTENSLPSSPRRLFIKIQK